LFNFSTAHQKILKSSVILPKKKQAQNLGVNMFKISALLVAIILISSCQPIGKQVFYGTLVLGDSGFDKFLEIKDEQHNRTINWRESGPKKIIVEPNTWGNKISVKMFTALGTPEASFTVPKAQFTHDEKNRFFSFTYEGTTFVAHYQDKEINRFELPIENNECWVVRHVKRYYFLTGKSGDVNIMSVKGILQNYANKIQPQELEKYYASSDPERLVERARCSNYYNSQKSKSINDSRLLNAHSFTAN
jgi:hypothetical protein